ncbi:MAG: prepilin-type N-terminal cleavage/methylation domain-containing protein, partial [Phycisphaerae bacterium]|nr:prepilin-type N-terminal cleavage/methylation domain-containing protein [Phycisphaerae bacterium]
MIPKLELNRIVVFTGFKERQTMCKKAFTLVEIIVVVVILGIAAMLVIPMGSSAASVQIRSAANTIAADIEYAKSLAITKGAVHSVLFDEANESYSVLDNTGTVVGHPVKKSSDYSIDFQTDNRLSEV